MKRASLVLAALLAGCAARTSGRSATPAGAAAASPRAPALPTARIALPPMHETTLENGLSVLLIEDHEIPVVAITLQFASGSEAETREKAGVASMATELLREGTKTRSADQIADAIDFVGGDLGSSTDDDSMTLSAKVLRKDFGVALALLSDEVTAPMFPAEEVEDVRRQLAASVKQRYDDPAELASLHARVLAYGDGDPYAIHTTEESVAAITRDDLVRFRETWLVPGRATLVIAGDVDASVIPAVRVAFAGWKAATPPAPKVARQPQTAALRILNDDELTQSFIAVALPGVDRHAPDYFSARVMDTVLGDGFSSRLNKVVRTESGKTYGVSGEFVMHRRPGVFLVTTSTRNSETAATLSLVMDQIKALQTGSKPVTASELAQARSSLIGAFPRRFETAEDVTGQVLWARLLGLPLDEITDYRRHVAAVTLADINAAARRYLDASNAVIVVCGKASEIREPLEKIWGPAEVLDFRAKATAARPHGEAK